MVFDIPGYFITGTDTGSGKTAIACAVIRRLRAAGWRVAPFKPIAAGAILQDGAWRNDDALQLLSAAGGDWVYDQINPYCFPDPVSPHIAARQAGVTVDLAHIVQVAQHLAAQADLLVVEGAGGWLAPLTETQTVADLAQALGFPVLLVVGLRLGCLNHAQLSTQAIQQAGVSLVGWMGTQLDPEMPYLADNIETLQNRLPSLFRGTVPYGQTEQTDYVAWVEQDMASFTP